MILDDEYTFVLYKSCVYDEIKLINLNCQEPLAIKIINIKLV